MAAGSTYTPIATTTLASPTSSISLSSIPSTYTDIYCVIVVPASSNNLDMGVRFNGDTGTNYSTTMLYGNGTAAGSSRQSNNTFIYPYSQLQTSDSIGNWNIAINNYSNTTTYKTALNRGGSANRTLAATVGLWRNTAAINQITFLDLSGFNLATGTSMTLYGITAA